MMKKIYVKARPCQWKLFLVWFLICLQGASANAITGTTKLLERGSFRSNNRRKQGQKNPREAKTIAVRAVPREPTALERIEKTAQQITAHASFGIQGSPRLRLLGLTSAAFYIAARRKISRSEPTRRAITFWKSAGPMVTHYKFTEWWLDATKAPPEHRNMVYGQLHDRYSTPALSIILKMKGLYVKIGQVMSSRSDFLPVQYIERFSMLHDSIPQLPIEEALSIVGEALESEYGLDQNEVFESVDPIAIGCASIGQVHRARLRDRWVNADPNYRGGKDVAIKIMHPEAKNRFQCDFQVFRWLLRVAMPGWSPLLEELERRLMTEFDYRNECKNLMDVRNNLLRSPYRDRVKVPEAYTSLSSKHLLVMEMLHGRKLIDAVEDKLSNVLGDKDKAHEFLAEKQRDVLFGEVAAVESKMGILELLNIHGIGGLLRAMKGLALYRQLHGYVDLLVDVHGHQIFQDATFNGDPHPGNILELSDGRLGLIDYGQTKHLDDKDRYSIAQVVVDLGRKADSDKIATSMRLAGFRSKHDNSDVLAQFAALFFDSDHASRRFGHPTPQHYFQSLMEEDPLIDIPDAAIMVARVSLLFRGAGSALNRQVQTSDNWLKHAEQCLRERK